MKSRASGFCTREGRRVGGGGGTNTSISWHFLAIWWLAQIQIKSQDWFSVLETNNVWFIEYRINPFIVPNKILFKSSHCIWFAIFISATILVPMINTSQLWIDNMNCDFQIWHTFLPVRSIWLDIFQCYIYDMIGNIPIFGWSYTNMTQYDPRCD